MSKFRFLQNSFRSGELGDKLLARTDTKQYQEACSEVLNMIPISQGGLRKRPGTQYINTSVADPGIIPFIFSKEEGYAIVLNQYGNPYILDKDGNYQTFDISAKTDNNSSQLTFPRASVAALLYTLDPNGWHYTQSGDVLVMVHNTGDSPPIVIKRQADGVFLGEFYTDSDDMGLRDTRKALRWPNQNINIEDDRWIQFNSETLVPGAGSDDDYYTYDLICRDSALDGGGGAAGGATVDDFWKAGEVGSLIKVTPYDGDTVNPQPTANELIFEILDIVNFGTMAPTLDPESSVARCKLIYPDQFDTGGGAALDKIYWMTKDWKKSYWSNENGFPVSVTQYEKRLFFGGNTEFPDTIWSSRSSDIFHLMNERFEQDKLVETKEEDVTRLNFYGVPVASDPIVFTPSTQEVNKIQWIQGASGLLIGTLGAEHILTGGDQGLAIDNVILSSQSSIGSANRMPAKTQFGTQFVARTEGRLLNMITNPAQLNSQTTDLNVLNEKIISHDSEETEDIKRIVSQPSTNTIWVLTTGDRLVSFTYDPENQITAWARHTFEDSTGISSLSIIPSKDGTFDDLWLSVRRKGVGVVLTRTTDLLPGQDTVDGDGLGADETELDFIDHEVELDPSGGVAYERRLVIRFPTDSEIELSHSSFSQYKDFLENKWFKLDDDTQSFGIWFDNGTGADPTGGTTDVVLPIVITGATSTQDIIDLIRDELDAQGAFAAFNSYHTLEKMGEEFKNNKLYNTSSKDADKPYFVDSSILSIESPAASVHSGFDHLEGKTISVMADGFYVGDKEVKDGAITLDNDASEVIAGYGYTSRLKTFPVEIGSDFGSSVGVIQRIDKVTFILYKTFALTAGYEIDKMDDLEFIPPDYVVGDPIPLFTGRHDFYFPASPEDEQFVIMEQTKPYPCTILGISMRGKAYDASQ